MPKQKEKPRRKWPEKNTQEYSEKRSQNNVAVRKSREKAKMKQLETKQRVDGLKEDNQNLELKVQTLKKELSVLKDLFTAHASGAAPPRQMTDVEPTVPKPDLSEVGDPVFLDHVYSNSSSPRKPS